MVQQHNAMIHKVCRIYGRSETDRQDLFQEIIIQLWKAYPNFRGDSKFSTWLYRIALNTAISDLRKQQRRVKMLYPEEVPYEASAEAMGLTIPDEFICPLTSDVMTQPLMTRSGISFEREAIVAWLQDGNGSRSRLVRIEILP